MGEEEFGPVMSTALSPAGDRLACGYHEGNVRVFDVVSGKVLRSDIPMIDYNQ